VRAIIGGSEYYNTLIIEDKNELGYGWSYTHTYYFNVKVGDEVMRGDLLSVVHFQGLEHIHLTRVKLVSGGSWSNLTNLESMMPDEYFQIPDSIPPVIQTPFYYFKDNTNVIIDNSAVPMLSGKVDIVVGMREAGEYEHGQAGSLAPGFGDRNCVNRIEYEILSGQNVIMQKRSFDFSKVTFIPGPDGYKKVDIAYKPYYLFEPERNYWSKVLSYFIITNWDENHQLGQFSSADEAGCWDTSELNSDGSRRFPNGSYTVKVIAYDFAGNSSSNEQNVTINN
jgi:hypothetical protein